MNIDRWSKDYMVDLSLKYNSIATISMYHHNVKKFLTHFKEYREPKEIPTRDIKKYLLSFNTINTRKQNLCAIKRFYEITLKMPNKVKKIPYPKKEKKLPLVIDSENLLKSIENIDNLKHKAIISLAYSTGMRVSEIINLKIKDIDSKRMLILVRQAKGNKDRFVPLSKNILKTLRLYYKKYKPKEYLFNGQFSLQYSATSCNKIVKKYLGEEYHFHTLRHSSFTTMLESGTNLRIIQKIAGHESPKTTAIYTHISNNFLSTVNTPI